MLGLIAKPWGMSVASTSGATLAAAFPAVNTTNNDYGRVLVTNDGQATNTTLKLVYDLGVALPVDVLGLLWHNFPVGGKVTVTGSASASMTSPEVVVNGASIKTGDTARDSLAFRKTLYTLSSPKTYRYWQIEIIPPTGGNLSNCSLSRVFIGLGAKFAIGPQKAVISAKDMNAKVTTEIGEERSSEDAKLIRPIVSLSLDYARESEMSQVLGQYTLSLGTSKPLLICGDLTSPYIQDNLVFGRPDKVVSLESTIFDVWSFEAVVPSLGV